MFYCSIFITRVFPYVRIEEKKRLRFRTHPKTLCCNLARGGVPEGGGATKVRDLFFGADTCKEKERNGLNESMDQYIYIYDIYKDTIYINYL